jgi:hypothetical protein
MHDDSPAAALQSTPYVTRRSAWTNALTLSLRALRLTLRNVDALMTPSHCRSC